MLKGPGLAAQDEIYVSLWLQESQTLLRAMLHIQGHNGVLPDNVTYEGHINSSGVKQLPLGLSTVGYWFVASGRRFYIGLKTGMTYGLGGGGLYIPYASPAGHPYPAFVGGTTTAGISSVGLETTGTNHAFFTDPAAGQLAAQGPTGTWLNFDNGNADDDYETGTGGARTFPYNISAQPRHITSGGGLATPPGWGGGLGSRSWGMLTEVFVRAQVPLLGGSYLLTPITLNSMASNAPGVYGILDGIFFIPGVGVSAEDTVTIGGDTYLILPNVYRTANQNFIALKLE